MGIQLNGHTIAWASNVVVFLDRAVSSSKIPKYQYSQIRNTSMSHYDYYYMYCTHSG